VQSSVASDRAIAADAGLAIPKAFNSIAAAATPAMLSKPVFGMESVHSS